MFFFKSALTKPFHGSSVRQHSARNFFSQKALALMFMFCLSAALLITGCKEDASGSSSKFVDDHKLNSSLIEEWSSPYGDGYVITANKITYDDGGYGSSSTGTIQYVSNFTSNAGVIIIKYDDDKKPSYWEYDDAWNPIEELPLKGDFIGIYYKNLKPGVSVSMANAYIDGGAEEATLDDAKKAFTAGNEGKYIMYYGEYTK
jgi:hypothetical protein